MKTSRSIPLKVVQKLTVTSMIGAAVLGLTAVVSPDRAWANLLLISFYLITLGLGGALFIALTNVCGARWNAAFRRVPESLTGLLPAAGVMLLGTLAIRLPEYAWHHHGSGGAGTFWFKEAWLSTPFFAGRAVLFVALWIVLSRLVVRASRRWEGLSTNVGGRSRTRLSVLFLAIFAVTISLAGVDWIMALEPMWFSTMWGVYQFAGLILATLAAIVVACIVLRKMGPLAGIFTDDHLHDLGQLLIGFSCFWMYIWFSQYMLIWYSNIPEETSYFIPRLHGPWGPVVVGTLLLNWGIPFFALLPQPAKRSETVMLRIAVLLLIGRWADLYVMIFPPVTESAPWIGVAELAAVVALFGLAGWQFAGAFGTEAGAESSAGPELGTRLADHA